MATKLFVRGLPWATDGQALREAFEQFGTVSDSVVVNDRETGRSRGFGFVSFDNDDEAQKALAAMDGAALGGRNIQVKVAEDRPRRAGGGPRGPHRSGGPPRSGGPGRGGPRQGGGPGRGGDSRRGPGGPRTGGSRDGGGGRGGYRGGGGPGGSSPSSWAAPPPDENSWGEDRVRRRDPANRKKKKRRDEEGDPRVRDTRGRKPRGGGGSKRVAWEEDDW